MTEEKKVYLVGAGPGSTYLITVRAQTVLRHADVIVYDYLANDILLELTSPDSEKIYVGKHSGCHTLAQDEINKLLAEKWREGNSVVRLKGGDPYVFGRGGEEGAYLRAEGIPFEVVPGVTSATAALAYAGIPITHRGLASCATIITGHEDPTKEDSDVDWEALARMKGTLVFYMGVKRLPLIAQALIDNGKPKETPAALVRLGTMPQQQTVAGTLETITDRVSEAGLKPPALIVVGSVVSMREQLLWYEDLPLFGTSIVVTRSIHQAHALSEKLSILGAEVIHRPTIEICRPDDLSKLDACMANGGDYDWVIFSSTNGVKAFADRMREKDLDIRAFAKAKFAGVGKTTRNAIGALGVRVDFVPEKFTSSGFVEEFQRQYPDLAGKRILFPTANIARDIIPEGLKALGAEVDRVTAYETRAPQYDPDEFRQMFERHDVSLATFTSSSTVDNFMEAFPESDWQAVVETLKAASIGPMTTKTLRKYGIEPALEAETHTIPGLVEAIVSYNLSLRKK